MQTPVKSSWLLALCGVLEALLALMTFFMMDHGSLISRIYSPKDLIMNMCMLAMAAGICAIAAGIWSTGKSRSWLLVLNGLALCAYGLIPALWRGPLMLRPFFILLLVAMAMSIGIFALTTVLSLRDHVPDKWFLGVAGAASVGFALAFFAYDFRWITLSQPVALFLLMGSYFAFSAICMWGLALRQNSLRASNALATA
jgi:uncharacterized membrane protein HdeD (DUF308 family)